jgi:hypothetical protein
VSATDSGVAYKKLLLTPAFIRHKQLAARRAELFQEMLD